MMRKARHEVADDDTVMAPVDTGATHNTIGIAQIIRQIFEARIVEFVRGNTGRYGAWIC
jgi:hypothetical protein